MGFYKTPEKDKNGNIIERRIPFASKAIPEGKLFKRVHGTSGSIGAGQTVSIDLVVAYDQVKFSGAEIFGCDLGDIVNFTVHDTPTNSISGLDVGTYGANIQLNQFGFNVEMPPASIGTYKNTSEYDADLFKNMILRCTYTNNGGSTKYIGVNFELHEVKP
jgi:hypothetical protein